jgi:hypothetical protein
MVACIAAKISVNHDAFLKYKRTQIIHTHVSLDPATSVSQLT